MPNSAPMHAAKAAFRSRLLASRRALTAEVRASADAALVAGAVQLVRGRAAAAYVPMTGEPGGPALLDALAGAARRLLLPILREDLDLDWAEGPPVRPAGHGLFEPSGPALGPTAIATVEVVLVPAVAVDRQGVRLGRGGGSFDRALARVDRATLTALLYDGELLDRLPAEPHGRKVHAVLTPSGLMTANGG